MMAARWLAGALSPAGRRGGLSILLFHRVLAQADEMRRTVPDAKRFDQILSWVGSAFTVLPLDEAIRRLREGRLPARALAITFDDGYADNYTVALPVLRRHGMSATFFVTSDYIDGGRMWNDTVTEAVRNSPHQELDLLGFGLGRQPIASTAERRHTVFRLLRRLKYLPLPERQQAVDRVADLCAAPSLPNDLMLSSTQLRALRDAGMLIGGHTRSHPILARLDDADAREEIVGGKQRLEALLGEPISLFAYPNGKPEEDFAARHAAMARAAGFEAALTTAAGMARQDTDPFQLPRFTPWDRTHWRFGLRMARNMRMPVHLVA